MTTANKLPLIESFSVSGLNETPFFDDPYTNKSWYLAGSDLSSLRIDVEPVWEDYMGSGVKVGVIDTQIDYKHDDLKNAYDHDLDYNYVLDTADPHVRPASMDQHHGTYVAGIISAEGGNGIGSVGIASKASLVGFGIDYSSPDTLLHILTALQDSASLDVVNNSRGCVGNFAGDFANHSNGEIMASVLEQTVTEGRDGLGTNVVFAAGNEGTDGSSNYHNFQNSPYAISVGAVGMDGSHAWFSSIGSNNLLSAAGVDVFTTKANDKYQAPDGTSFAAPAVSGVVALMLEANPELGYRDVQQILSLSSTRGGLGEGNEMGHGWVTTGTTGYNGGGMHYSDTFGFGFLNAFNAVRLAETWTKQQTAANRDSIEKTVKVGEHLIAGEVDHLSIDIEVTEAILAEHIQLSMDTNWTLTGDMEVYLTSPNGTTVQLVYDLPDVERAGRIDNFAFSSVGTMGELGQGTWTLDIYNNNTSIENRHGDAVSGLFRDVTLTIHGETDGVENSLYVYNDEFGELYTSAELKGRTTLSDTDGGNDTINAASVTYDSFIDLSGAQNSQIAGVTVKIDPNSIENVFSGDGDDTLFGSAADNLLNAGRGDDRIYYSAGQDTVIGGEGQDTMVFQDSFSNVYGYISDAGDFMIGLLNKGYTMVSGIEIYAFTDVVYTIADLFGVFDDSDPVVDDTPPEDDTPVEEPVDDTPVEEPVDDTPVDEPVDDTPTDTPDEPVDEPNDRTYGDTIYGTDGEDRLRADEVETMIYGELGDDYLVGSNFGDYLDGGDGHDKVRGFAGDDIVYGGAGNDTLHGNEGHDQLIGGAGDDKLFADDGDDTLAGGAGADRMKGGAGADTFIFDIADIGSLDLISDFNASEGDRILIQGLGASSSATFHFVEKGRYTYLEMVDADSSATIAKILGEGVSELSISEQANDHLILA